jgi:hypothetical protein
MRIKLFFSFLLVTVIQSCRHDTTTPASPVVSFMTDVQPTLVGNCSQSGCHGNEDSRRFSLVTYDDVMNSGTVVPGDAHNSSMYEAITGRSQIMPRPPQPPLNDLQIGMIYIWINQGAKNN